MESLDLQDDVDMLSLLRYLLSRWVVLLAGVILGVVISGIYIYVTVPVYKASATFFVPTGQPSGSDLSKYASLLGQSSGLSILGDQVSEIILSRRIQLAVATRVLSQYQAELGDALKSEKYAHFLNISSPNVVVADQILDFKHNVRYIKTKNNLFNLEVLCADPRIGKDIVSEYLAQLNIIYVDLELGSERHIIKVLDSPQVTMRPVKPKKMLTLLGGGLFGGLIIALGVLFRYPGSRQGNRI